MIKIDFERQTEYGTYRDALTLADNHTLSQAEIDAMMQQRVDAWLTVITTPPQEEPQQDFVEIDGVKYVKAE